MNGEHRPVTSDNFRDVQNNVCIDGRVSFD